MLGMSATLARRALRVHELLLEHYGEPVWRTPLPALDELVSTILSQNTNDTNRDKAFALLRAALPTWEAVRDADPAVIAEAIKGGGLARIKAPRIKMLLQRLSAERGRLDLDDIPQMGLEKGREFLLDLDGVGPKTAACVLLFSCGLPAFPVDTHVHRVARRLGLIGPSVSAEEAHRILEKAVPPPDVYSVHVNLITHGRLVCKSQRPRCQICVLAPRCDYFAGKGTSVG